MTPGSPRRLAEAARQVNARAGRARAGREGIALEEEQVVELEPTIGSLALCYILAGAFGLFAAVWLLRGLDRPSGFAWSVGAVLFAVLPPVAMVGFGVLLVRSAVLKTITLGSEGIGLRVRGREAMTPWSAVDRITLKRVTRLPSPNGAPISRIVMVVECPGQGGLTFGSGFETSPEELFEVFGAFVRARSIPVPMVRGPG